MVEPGCSAPVRGAKTGRLTVSISRESLVAEQLRLLLRSSFPIFAAAATTLVALVALRGQIAPPLLYGWGATMLGWQALRYALWRRFRRVQADDGQARRWALPFTVLMTGSGLLWGVFAYGFYQVADFETRVFMLFVITAMLTGGAVSFTAFLPVYYGYVFGATLPVAAAFLWHDTGPSLLMGGMTLVYVGLLVFMARAANRGVTELIELKLEKAVLVGDLVRAKDTAEQASRIKSHFLANMSHELRTPLNAIIGFSDVIRRQLFGPVGDTRYHDYVGDINRSGHHLLRLVNDILDISKLEAGAMEVADDLVDVGQLVTECARFIRTQAAAAGVGVALDLPPALPALRADELRFKQVILNLLTNAVNFSQRGGTVAVTARLAGDGGMALVVRDDGIGMTEDEIVIALQPFRQIESATTRRHAGTGLGLPLAKSLVERHGGTLWIDSRRGRGTTVTVSLPAERVVTRPAAADLAQAAG